MGILEQVISEDQELKGNGRWLHGTENDSLVIDAENQVFFWNSKDIVGDAITYLIKVRGLTFKQAKEYLQRFDPLQSAPTKATLDNGEEFVPYEKLVDIFYENGKVADREYWNKRGLDSTTIDRFKLGYHVGWYMIPIYQDGVFRNFQQRHDIPFKQIYPYYRHVGRLLFNSDILKLTDQIVIVEGPTNCLRLLQDGIPSVSHNAGAEGWDNNWFKYFIKQKLVYIVYDNDSAGENGAKKVAENLGLYRTRVYTFKGASKKGYDVIDYFNEGNSASSFMDLIRRESKYAFQKES